MLIFRCNGSMEISQHCYVGISLHLMYIISIEIGNPKPVNCLKNFLQAKQLLSLIELVARYMVHIVRFHANL